MILSNQQLFSDDQAVTATAISTNVIDLGLTGTPYGAAAPLNGDVGKGNPIESLFQVTADFATLTSLTVAIETGATASLGTVLASVVVPVAALKTGYRLPIRFIPDGLVGRYLGMRYTVTGSNATAGTVTAGITLGVQTNITGP
jgi:hypothetical protein